MRIGIDASNLRAGGGLTYISNLLNSYDPSELGISFVKVWAGKSTLEMLCGSQSWLKLIHVPDLDGPMHQRLFWRRFYLTRVVKPSCDILFQPGASGHVNFSPTVAMSQNMLPFEMKEAGRFKWSFTIFRYILIRWGLQRAFSRSAGNIFLTNYAFESINHNINGLQKRHAIIPHGIDQRFLCKPRDQKEIDQYSFSNPFKLLYVSIINLYKHQWNVLKAVKLLREKGLPVTIDFVGPAYPAALYKLQKASRLFDPNNEFSKYHGPIPYDKLPAIYQAADAFVFASSCENLPIILLEAMAAGLPIACSNKGPMPEVLKDGGSYFDPESSEQIADAIEKIIRDAKLRLFYSNISFNEAQSYSWEKCAKQTFVFLKNIAEEHLRIS